MVLRLGLVSENIPHGTGWTLLDPDAHRGVMRHKAEFYAGGIL